VYRPDDDLHRLELIQNPKHTEETKYTEEVDEPIMLQLRTRVGGPPNKFYNNNNKNIVLTYSLIFQSEI